MPQAAYACSPTLRVPPATNSAWTTIAATYPRGGSKHHALDTDFSSVCWIHPQPSINAQASPDHHIHAIKEPQIRSHGGSLCHYLYSQRCKTRQIRRKTPEALSKQLNEEQSCCMETYGQSRLQHTISLARFKFNSCAAQYLQSVRVWKKKMECVCLVGAFIGCVLK